LVKTKIHYSKLDIVVFELLHGSRIAQSLNNILITNDSFFWTTVNIKHNINNAYKMCEMIYFDDIKNIQIHKACKKEILIKNIDLESFKKLIQSFVIFKNDVSLFVNLNNTECEDMMHY
jgi:hypothetical protein